MGIQGDTGRWVGGYTGTLGWVGYRVYRDTRLGGYRVGHRIPGFSEPAVWLGSPGLGRSSIRQCPADSQVSWQWNVLFSLSQISMVTYLNVSKCLLKSAEDNHSLRGPVTGRLD